MIKIFKTIGHYIACVFNFIAAICTMFWCGKEGRAVGDDMEYRMSRRERKALESKTKKIDE